MNKRVNKYREVDSLSPTAMTVNEYAAHIGKSDSQIYKLWRQHAAGKKEISFEIVVFKRFNYVLRRKPQ